MSKRHPTTREFMAGEADEYRFFSRVMLPNGTFKTTARNRLDDLNTFSLPFILSLKPPIRIMDVAASSGASTAEWANQLKAARLDFSMIATDRQPSAKLVSVLPGFEVMIDEDGNVLHADLAGFGFSSDLKIHSNAYLLPIKLAAFGLFRLAYRIPRPSATVDLKSPSLDGIHLSEDDLLRDNPVDWIGAFDVVRAANILNLVYFPEVQLKAMLRTAAMRLRDGGLLIVSRTSDRNHASIFRLNDKRLEVAGRLGNGSEVEDLCLRTSI
jgi:hypothetical protein